MCVFVHEHVDGRDGSDAHTIGVMHKPLVFASLPLLPFLGQCTSFPSSLMCVCVCVCVYVCVRV